ncbi:MAG: FliH/SctL family protein [Acidobacteriota bacterium]|nr:FliH/SctL family protein [Acidobacteriota bacterium]
MASRLLIGDKASEAKPVSWRGTAGAGQQSNPASAAIPDEQQARVQAALQARIQELERELDSRPREAFQRGFAEGQAAGAAQASTRVEPLIAKLAASLADLVAVRKKHLLEAEEDAVRLAVAVARRVLRRELSVDPESLLGIMKAAFERVDAREVLRVRLNPGDVPLLQRHLAGPGMPPRVELIPDSSLESGSIVVETTRGSLDASVSSQLQEIERGLVDLVRRSS